MRGMLSSQGDRIADLRAEQARMWNVLLDFCRSMGRALDIDTVLEQIVTTAAEMTCSRRVSLMLPDEHQQFLTIAKAIGIDARTRAEVRLPIGEAVAGQVFASGMRLTSTGGATPSGVEPAYDGESFVSMPIVAASLQVTQQRVGVLNITGRYLDRPFQEWELEFIDVLGGIAGSVIDDTFWRQARESLLKFECDLQIARRIQQSAYSQRLPTIRGFDVDAWSEPAEETGGDTYDIIGLERDPDGGMIHLNTDHAERAVLLLADATGHGIGPALSVTQVRAMLRMAVRLEPRLDRIVAHMNEQLCADLPRGRFITAWLGELNAAEGTLTCFSARQGPILRYDAARDRFDQMEADTIPLGILPDTDISLPDPLALKVGDIIAVISDGIFEAADGAGRQFGPERAVDVIRRHRGASADQILLALRRAVDTFVNGESPRDDRTAIIIKCTGG